MVHHCVIGIRVTKKMINIPKNQNIVEWKKYMQKKFYKH